MVYRMLHVIWKFKQLYVRTYLIRIPQGADELNITEKVLQYIFKPDSQLSCSEENDKRDNDCSDTQLN